MLYYYAIIAPDTAWICIEYALFPSLKGLFGRRGRGRWS